MGQKHEHCHGGSAAGAPATARPSAALAGPAAGPPLYTCPMHPEVERREPGACPDCGMALEPLTVTPEEETNAALDDMTRRFWWSFALTLPVFILSMSDVIPGKPLGALAASGAMAFLQFLFATPVVLWGGRPFFERGWASIRSGRKPSTAPYCAIGRASRTARLSPTMPASGRSSSVPARRLAIS